MLGIDIIKINIKKGLRKIDLLIDLNKNKGYLNNKSFNIEEKYLKNLIKVLTSFDTKIEQMINLNAEKCIIILYNDNKVIDKFIYQGSYPKTYQVFKNIIGEICKK